MKSIWNEPERGATGDHGQAGQDGRDGRQGEVGPRGPAGASGQGERGARGRQGGGSLALRLRMLTLYVVMVGLLAVVGYMYQRGEVERKRFEEAVVANCIANRDNTMAFNDFIDTLIATYQTSRVLTEKEKAQRAEFFEAAKGVVPECPPGDLR